VFGIWGLGFGVWGLWFEVWVSGCSRMIGRRIEARV
jgi:hypothetical protein